jgi:phosphomannomutase
MLQLLSSLRHKVAIGFVGGSDLAKQQEQLGTSSIPVTTLFDFCFAENGLTAYRMGQRLASQSFIGWLGEDKYKKLVNFLLRYIADLDIPVKRGTFVEFRNGMVNVSPIGRNVTVDERNEYERYDKEHHIREKMVEVLKKEFPDLGLTWVAPLFYTPCPTCWYFCWRSWAALTASSYSIGGQVSFDVFPTGWDKTYCLQHIEAEKNNPEGVEYTTIHFFGDKTYKGGNDYEIYTDSRTIGHSVKNPEETMAELKKLFF